MWCSAKIRIKNEKYFIEKKHLYAFVQKKQYFFCSNIIVSSLGKYWRKYSEKKYKKSFKRSQWLSPFCKGSFLEARSKASAMDTGYAWVY